MNMDFEGHTRCRTKGSDRDCSNLQKGILRRSCKATSTNTNKIKQNQTLKSLNEHDISNKGSNVRCRESRWARAFSYAVLGLFVIAVDLCFLHNPMTKIDLSMDSHQIKQVPVQENEQQKRRRLEFVHIPKTAGTAIESIATNANISWGVCNFASPEVVESMSEGIITCSPNNNHNRTKNFSINLFWREKECPWWHVPPAHLTAFYPGYDPYADADLFTIVRNPYTRMVSEYKYQMDSAPNGVYLTQSEEHFNQWIQEQLSRFSKLMQPGNVRKGIPGNRAYYGIGEGHLIPQYHFVYDKDNQRRVVKHIIFYENMHSDFSNLMAEYDIPLVLPEHRILPNNVKVDRKLGIANFTLSTIQLIEKVYEDDFLEFGYEMISSTLRNDKTK